MKNRHFDNALPDMFTKQWKKNQEWRERSHIQQIWQKEEIPYRKTSSSHKSYHDGFNFAGSNPRPHTKGRVGHNTVQLDPWVRPCKTWSSTQLSKQLLNTCERKGLREMFAAVSENDGWGIKCSRELCIIYESDDPKASEVIKLRKLQWADHSTREYQQDYLKENWIKYL